MLGLAKRKRQRRSREVSDQVGEIERLLFGPLRARFVKEHGDPLGDTLAQAVIDRLFARPVSLCGNELELVEGLAARLAKENQAVRDAAFISLRVMLEVAGANNNFIAERRIVDTIFWLKQFGEIPRDSLLPRVLDRLLSGAAVSSQSTSGIQSEAYGPADQFASLELRVEPDIQP